MTYLVHAEAARRAVADDAAAAVALDARRLDRADVVAPVAVVEEEHPVVPHARRVAQPREVRRGLEGSSIGPPSSSVRWAHRRRFVGLSVASGGRARQGARRLR